MPFGLWLRSSPTGRAHRFLKAGAPDIFLGRDCRDLRHSYVAEKLTTPVKMINMLIKFERGRPRLAMGDR